MAGTVNWGLFNQQPNFAGNALASFQAGQSMAKQQAIQNALANVDMSSPTGISDAQNALIRGGAPEQAAALEPYRTRQQNEAFAATQRQVLAARLSGTPAATASPPPANALAGSVAPTPIMPTAPAASASPDPVAALLGGGSTPPSGPNPRAALLRNPNELHAFLSTVAGEARGESPQGQAAVASVILNRALKTGQPVSAIVNAPHQFEGAGFNLDPNSPLYAQINQNVLPAVQGQDPTGGADHFYSPTAQAALGRAKPAWDNGTGTAIGRHLFFSLGYGGRQSAVDPGGVQVASNGPLPAGAAGVAPDPTSPPVATSGAPASMFGVGPKPTPVGYSQEDAQALLAAAHTPEQMAQVQKALDGLQEQHMAAYEQTSAAAIGAVRALRNIGDDSNQADLAKRKGAAVAYASRLGMDTSAIQSAPLDQFSDNALNGLENQLQAQRGYKGLDSFSTQLKDEAATAAKAEDTKSKTDYQKALLTGVYDGSPTLAARHQQATEAVARQNSQTQRLAYGARNAQGGYGPMIVLGSQLPAGFTKDKPK